MFLIKGITLNNKSNGFAVFDLLLTKLHTMKCVSCFFLLFLQLTFSQNVETTSVDIAISKYIDGTLLTPADSIKINTLAIIIGGSGPTDRDGNQNFLKCDALKKLAIDLTNQGFSTFRFDKRVVKDLKKGIYDNEYLFDDFVKDTRDIVDFFEANFDFDKVVLIGHSQGSLIAMLASSKADGLVSIAGPAESIDAIISKQIKQSAPEYAEAADKVLASLKSGQMANEYPFVLASLFNPSIQPFLMNWMSYNPKEIFSKMIIPSLIVSGSNDLQIDPEQAQMLAEANLLSQLMIIPNMNHVLVDVSKDPLENAKSYNEPKKPVNEELIAGISKFIKSL